MNVQSLFILFWGLRDNPLGNKATSSLTLVLNDAMDVSWFYHPQQWTDDDLNGTKKTRVPHVFFDMPS